MFVQVFNYTVKGPVVLRLIFPLGFLAPRIQSVSCCSEDFEVCRVLIEMEVPETRVNTMSNRESNLWR